MRKSVIVGEVPIPKLLKSKGPRALRIVSPTLDYYFELENNNLNALFLDASIKDRNPVIISVSGDFRKGKSFLLNYFIRYLDYVYGGQDTDGDGEPRQVDQSEWMGDKKEPLRGFSWTYGSTRQTTGIWVWSKVYKTTYHGHKIAIILMDTQGVFDNMSTLRESATVFGLSALLSSVNCYNVSQNIQENDLTNLQFFTEYGRLALEKTNGKKPFQKLVFIVRDWQYPYEADYGFDGGQYILDKRLEITPGQHEELLIVRKHIRSCFTDVSCFLMPHPGMNVVNPRFDGRVVDLQDLFVLNLNKLVHSLFQKDHLVIKKINEKPIKVQDLLTYMPAWLNVLNEGLPSPKTLFMATAEAHNMAAMKEAKDGYKSLMAEQFDETRYENPERIREVHFRIKTEVVNHFMGTPKMGDDEFGEKYKKRLEDEIDAMHRQHLVSNQSRKVMAWRIPVLWAGLLLSSYYLLMFPSRMNQWADITLLLCTLLATVHMCLKI